MAVAAPRDSGRRLYEHEVVRRILALREDLVRHDENEKAWRLLDECVPYFLADHPDIAAAHADQREMVAHLLDRDEYQRYYAENPHERPFEAQYGIPVAQAHRLPRIAFLRGELAVTHEQLGRELRVLDLGANDGFMAANIGELGYVITDCVDLHPGNCALARERKAAGAAIGRVTQVAAERAIVLTQAVCSECDYPASVGERFDFTATCATKDCPRFREPADLEPVPYDAVVAFELIEHVPSPEELLWAMAQCAGPGGRLYVSTPDGAVEDGDLPTWDRVERKGHVRSMREQDLRRVCATVGTVERIARGNDGVMVAVIHPAG